MVKNIIKYLAFGIAWGCSFFVIIGIVGELISGESFIRLIYENFIPNALGAVAVGILCGSSAIVYTIPKLSLSGAIAIHFVLGLGGYFSIAYLLNWMPRENIIYSIIFVLIGLIIFVFMWLGFFMYNRREARLLNMRLKELEKSRG